jgi:hypothetical protein
MAVITKWGRIAGYYHRSVTVTEETGCSLCGSDLYELPFVHWQGVMPDVDLFICAECCRFVRRNLTDDMDRVAAIKRAQDAPPGSPTLRAVQ